MFKKECAKCGAEKEGSYVSSSYCKECKSAIDKERRLKKRLAEGKKPWGTGPSTLCSRCGNEKGEKYIGGGYCGPCKVVIAREKAMQKKIAEGKLVPDSEGEIKCSDLRRSKNTNYCSDCTSLVELGLESRKSCKYCKAVRRSAKLAKARADAGKPPVGTAIRQPECIICLRIKENKDSGYCNECKRVAAKEKRLRQKEDPSFAEKERERKRKEYHESEFSKLKINVRVQAYMAIKAGKLIRKPCEVCGKLRVDAHHDDYSKPFDVRWLCRTHHREHHNRTDKTEN